jgi:arylsulfatase A-like enzyme
MSSITTSVIDTPARHVDIAPTVLEALGVTADGPP